MEGWANRILICDSCHEYTETLVPRFFVAHVRCPMIRVAEAPAPADATPFSTDARSEGEPGEHYFTGCYRCSEAVEVVHRKRGKLELKDPDQAQRFLLRHQSGVDVMARSEMEREQWRSGSEAECDCAAPDIRPLLNPMYEMFEKYYVDGPVEIEIQSDFSER